MTRPSRRRKEAPWWKLGRLRSLGSIAYRPFSRHASDGFHQVLSLPPDGSPEAMLGLEDEDIQ